LFITPEAQHHDLQQSILKKYVCIYRLEECDPDYLGDGIEHSESSHITDNRKRAPLKTIPGTLWAWVLDKAWKIAKMVLRKIELDRQWY